MNTSTQMIAQMVSSTQSLLSQIAPGTVELFLVLFLAFWGFLFVSRFLLGGIRRATR